MWQIQVLLLGDFWNFKKYFQSMVGWLHGYRTLWYEGWAIQVGLPFKPLYIGRGILKTIRGQREGAKHEGKKVRVGRNNISTMCGFISKWSVWPTSLEVGHWRQLLYDSGKEGRGHCQSSAEETMSFKHKLQWLRAWIEKIHDRAGGNSEQMEVFRRRSIATKMTKRDAKPNCLVVIY